MEIYYSYLKVLVKKLMCFFEIVSVYGNTSWVEQKWNRLSSFTEEKPWDQSGIERYTKVEDNALPNV